MSDNTIRSYQTDLKKMFSYMEANGYADMTSVSEKALGEYVDRIKEKELSPSTIARNIVSIKAFFKSIYKKEMIPYDISENIKAPKVTLPEIAILTRTQIEELLSLPDTKSPKGQRDSAMLELMYATGIKVSEVIGLKVSDLDMQIGNATCRGTKTDRTIPFDKRAKDSLFRYLQDGRRHLIKSNLEELLFVNYQGESMSRQGVWKMVKEYAKRAGIQSKITPEILRHSFAAHLIDRGADLDAVQQMMGHVSSLSTGRYAKENKDYIRNVYNQTHSV